MTPPMPNPTGASSEALLEAMQAPPPAAGAPSFRMFLASVLAAAATVVAVELLTDLQKDRIVSLLMLAFGAVVVMIVLTSMLIRKSRHAIALANALAPAERSAGADHAAAGRCAADRQARPLGDRSQRRVRGVVR